MDAIVTRDLCKRYGPREVLQKVNLKVPAGGLFGFLGPNGAGKTTTIRILLGLLRASAGGAQILGQDVWRNGPRVRRQVGYLPGDVHFYDQLTGRATLRFCDAARGGGAAGEIQRLATRFDLDLDKKIRSYSRGMKQKLGLIQALMHRPQVLILDEPTTALDPLVKQTLNEELRQVAAAGRTVLFSSHTLGEVEELCDFVAIVRDGRLIEQESIDVLRRRAVRRIEAVFRPGASPPAPLPDGLRIIQQTDGRLTAAWTGTPGPLLEWLARSPVTDVMIAPPSLEDLFLTYYGHEPAEAGA